MIVLTVLDPRISYDGLLDDFTEEPQLLKDLNDAKQKLYDYYNTEYAQIDAPDTSLQQTNAATSSSKLGSQTSSFTARYQRHRQTLHQLDEYFKLSREPDFDNCDPLEWWRAYRKKWPQLYRLACDILAIPGLFHCF